MRVAVIGGGINGVMSAWSLARHGCEVTLFERGALMSATSSASTKLLHGGLRYLETGQLGLVREALRERRWWIEQAPHLAHPLRILIPVFRHSRRGRWLLRLGLSLYDLLAGDARLGPTQWLPVAQVRQTLPELRTGGLLGAYAFHDGQMDDHALGLWAAERASAAGVRVRAGTCVARLHTDGCLRTAEGDDLRFDRIVNAAGPWAASLLAHSGIATDHQLDLVRGSHLLIERPLRHAVLLEAPRSERVCFALPYQGSTLLGTTEERQTLADPVVMSVAERAFLRDMYDRHFDPPLSPADGERAFSGLRPLLKSHRNPTRALRGYALERRGNVITVFGGKWTTARALGEKVAASTLR